MSGPLPRMFELHRRLNLNNVQKSYNSARYYRDEIREQHRWGHFSLRERALADNLFLAIVQGIVELLPQLDRVPEDLEELRDDITDIYYGLPACFNRCRTRGRSTRYSP
ncbi:MAG: hypothetical protein R3E54_14690 [Halioglobus sp.]